MPGPRPRPTKLKILRGERKDRINDNEPTPEACIPDAPTCLPAEGKREWDRIAKELHALGILTRCDRGILTTYCRAWARLVRASAEVEKRGIIIKGPNGGQYQNPWENVANKAAEQVAKFGSMLGLDPTSRTRIRVDASKRDDFESFLNEAG